MNPHAHGMSNCHGVSGSIGPKTDPEHWRKAEEHREKAKQAVDPAERKKHHAKARKYEKLQEEYDETNLDH